jgi:hypothetical protein
MAAEPRTFSILQSALVGGLINAAINGALGLALPEGQRLPLLGLPSLSADIVAMAFGIAFGTGIGVTPLTRRERRAGKLVAPALTSRMERALEDWPSGILRRSLLLGVIGVVLFAPPMLLALWVLGVDSVDRWTFVELKAGWAFVEGALVTPPIAVAALLDAEAAPAKAPPQAAA